ncbi:MAG: response regulator [Chloroflexi bacterium]|nr:response regulator [Chloroflexota bacterium]
MSKAVLIADDDELLRTLLSILAETFAEGYEVLLACDGAEALALARARDPDLILLDVTMPNSDGFHVCRALKNDPATANTPVILMSAESGPEVSRMAIDFGAAAFFGKPYSPVALIDECRAILERSRSHAPPRAATPPPSTARSAARPP